jgi:hypothetical protein
MTTFTTEDREWAFWHTYDTPKYNRQVEIEFFFPLTEQIPLDLDYEPTHLYYRAKGIAGVSSMPIQGSIHEFTTVPITTVPTWTTSINIDTNNIVVTSEKIPPLARRLLYKLLGIRWKKK